MKFVPRYLLVPVTLFLIFQFLNFNTLKPDTNTILLSITHTTIAWFSWCVPRLRPFLLIIILVAFAIMLAFYLSNNLETASMFGRFGLSVWIFLSLSYLPILVKIGKIERW
jgi:hypothetical protein